MDLTDKVAIVTGGGSGIGREICLECAARGAAVVVASNQPDQVDEVFTEVVATGGRAIDVDVTKDDEVIALVAAAAERYGTPDILVNAAAIGQDAVTPDRDNRTFDTMTRPR
jgi:NAD(P)-dependent dehydrogenase (short-subunit alcohol dehydrogenase family)